MEWIWEIAGFALLVVIGLLIYLFRIPGISTDRDRLIIQYSLIYRILTLGLNIKKTTIDKSNQMVVMDRRILWIYSKQQLLYFENLKSIDFSYKNSGFIMGDTEGKVQTARITYNISLVDKNHVHHDIFSLKSSNLSGLAPGEFDDMSYFSGIYGDEARSLVDLVEGYTGLEVGRSLMDIQSSGLRECPHCGQMTSKRKDKCLYCGEEFA